MLVASDLHPAPTVASREACCNRGVSFRRHRYACAVFLQAHSPGSGTPGLWVLRTPAPHHLASSPPSQPVPEPRRPHHGGTRPRGLSSYVTLDRPQAGTDHASWDKPEATKAGHLRGRGQLHGSDKHREGYGNRPPSPAVLTSWIKSAREVSRLARLVRMYGSEMNHIHVSATVTHLSQLITDNAVSATELAAAMDPNDLPVPTGQQARPSAASTATADISSLAGARTSGQRPRPEASRQASPSSAAGRDNMAGLVQALLALIHSHLPAFEPRQLANTAWALGKWPAGVPGRDEALAAIVRASGRALGEFRAQELANMLHGCAAAFATSASAPGSCNGSEPAAAPSGSAPMAPYGAVAAASVSPSSGPAPPLAPAAPENLRGALTAAFLWEHAGAVVAQLRLRRFKMQELSNLLWAWGVLVAGEGAQGQQAAGSLGQQAAGSLHVGPTPMTAAEPGQAAPLAASVAAAGAPGQSASSGPAPLPPLVVPYAVVLREQLRLGLASADPQELVNSVCGLARLQVPPPFAWFDAFLCASRRHLLAAAEPRHPLGPQSEADTGHSAATTRNSSSGSAMASGTGPPRSSTRAARPEPASAHSHSSNRNSTTPAPPSPRQPVSSSSQPPHPQQRLGFHPQELANLLWACSKLRLRLPAAFLDDAAPALERSLPHMNLQERVNVLWALAWQAKLDAEDWDERAPAGPRRDVGDAGEGAGQAAGMGDVPSTWLRDPVPGDGEQRRREQALGISRGDGVAPAGAGAEVGELAADSGADSGAGRPSPSPSAHMRASESQQQADAGGVVSDQRSLTPSSRSTSHAPVLQPHQPARLPGRSAQDPRGQQAQLQPRTSAAGAAAAAGAPQVGHAGPWRASPPSSPQDTTGRHTASGFLQASLLQKVVAAALGPTELRQPRSGQDAGAAEAARRRPQDVSMSLWSLAVLNGAPAWERAGGPGPGGAPGGYATVGSPSAAAAAGAPGVVPLFSQAEMDALVQQWWQCLRGMRPQEQANCIWAAARLGLRLSPGMMEELGGWLRVHAALLGPAEASAVVRGLGELCASMPPLRGIAAAVHAILEQVYLRHERYSRWELSQVCYGGAMVVRWLGEEAWVRAVVASASGALAGPGGVGYSSSSSSGSSGSGPPSLDGEGGSGPAGRRWEDLPAATQIRMSLDIEDEEGLAAPVGGNALTAAATAAVRQQQRSVAAPVDRLLLQLQRAYRLGGDVGPRSVRGGSAAAAAAADGAPAGTLLGSAPPQVVLVPTPEELAMALESVGLMLLHGQPSDARGSDLAVWGHDFVGLYVCRTIVNPSYHVRRILPLMHGCAMMAVGAVHVARQRQLAADERRRRSAAVASDSGTPASSMDEFVRSGRIAERRLQLRQTRQREARLREEQQQEQEQQQTQQQHQAQQRRHQAAAAAAAAAAEAAAAAAAAARELARVRAAAAAAAAAQQQAVAVSLSPAWRASGLRTDCLERLWSTSPPDLHELTPKEVAMLLWALAALSAAPPRPWLLTLLAAVRPHPGDNPTAAPAAATSGPGAATSNGAKGNGSGGSSSRGRGEVAGLTDQTLGLLLWGLGRLEVEPPAEWMEAMLAEVEAWVQRGGDDGGSSGGNRNGSGGAGDRGQLTAKSVETVIRGLAGIRWTLQPEWVGRLVRAVAPQLARMDPTARGKVYLAVVSLDPKLADRLGRDFSRLLASGLDGLDSGRGRWARAGGGGAGGEEGAGQRRSLFSRARGGW